jgi:hypothetical protein
MYSQSLTVTKQLPELQASLEVSFGHLKSELSSTIEKTDETIKHRGYIRLRELRYGFYFGQCKYTLRISV